jgi:hypothetical protein
MVDAVGTVDTVLTSKPKLFPITVCATGVKSSPPITAPGTPPASS